MAGPKSSRGRTAQVLDIPRVDRHSAIRSGVPPSADGVARPHRFLRTNSVCATRPVRRWIMLESHLRIYSHCRLGLVAAHPDDPDLFWPLAQSIVPGRRQTSVRAEILAATSALRYAARGGTPIRIWSDNAQVVDTLRQALADPDTCRLSPKDQDLLTTLLEVARQVRQLPVTVHKIASHQCKTGTDWVEWWAFTGNDHADHCATWSLKYPQALVKLWQQAISDLDAARVLRDQVHSTMIKISEYALISDIPLDAADPPPLEHALTRTEATIAPLPRLPQTATHKLVGDGWERLTEWSNSLIKAEAEIIFVPWLYMYIDYVLHTNSGGIQPSNAYSRWTWLDRETAGQHPVVLRVKWFRLLCCGCTALNREHCRLFIHVHLHRWFVSGRTASPFESTRLDLRRWNNTSKSSRPRSWTARTLRFSRFRS